MYQHKSYFAVHRGLAYICLLLLSGATWAQTGADAPDEIEEMIVTGTRLPQPNLVSTSPIQVVDAEEIKISGRNDISDILQLLPQNFSNDLGQDLGNRTSGLTTAGGVATADLRGLGPNRTLVLVNGRRLGNGSPYTAIQSPAPDLDQIPTRLVERVDVVTGGASAVYGSDAIAGVINFIMKRDFEGLELDAAYGFNRHDNHHSTMQQVARDAGFEPDTGTNTDGKNKSFSLIGGANTADGRGNFTVYVGYQDQNGVRSDARDFGTAQLFADTDDDGVPTGEVFMGGSSNSNFFQPKSGPFGQDPTAVFSVSGNEFVPRGSVETNPPAVFNAQKDITMSRTYDRWTAGFMGHYDWNERVRPYAEFGFMNDRTRTEVGPSALFRQSNPLTVDGNYLINCSNPLLSDQQRNILCTQQQILDDTAVPGSALASVEIGRRNVEGGQRLQQYEHTNYRAVLGATGDLAPGWSYDAYGQYYYVQFYTTNQRYLNFERITDALQVTTDDDGNPVCIVGGSCVPYNIFTEGGVTQDSLDAMYTDGTAYGRTRLETWHIDVTGDLNEYGIKLPTANEGIAFNVGYETREETVNFAPDSAELSGLLSGFGGASVAIDEKVKVDEYFAEVRIPLVQDKPGIRDLSFDAGYRNSDYSTTGSEDTYKLELQYAPIDSVRLRGSYNRAIRAPSIIELFNPQLVGQITIGADPCAPTLDSNFNLIPAAASLSECLRTVSSSQAAAFTAAYGNGSTTNTIPQGTASQLSQLQGGNQELTPEKADTYTVGLTITPEALPALVASIDYYHIKLEDAVSTLPAGVILNTCPTTGDTVFCSQLVRQPQTFSLQGASVAGGGYIVQTNQNIAGSVASGVDLQASYLFELPRELGSLNVSMAGSYMIDNKTTPYPGAHEYDCAGLFGITCQTINPEWRHIIRATWVTPWKVTGSLSWRYIGEVKEDNNDSDETLRFSAFAGIDTFNAKIGAQSYFDLAGTYTPLDNVELRVGINNLFDKNPPVLTSEIVGGGSPNTYATYDIFGRQIFMAFNVKF